MSNAWPELGPHLNDFHGDWNAYLDACYHQYEKDFYKGSRPWPVAGQRLNLKRMPVDADGRCNTFWHIATEGETEPNRTPDLTRLERIAWPMAMLREFASTYPQPASSKVCWWMNSRGREGRYILALADFSYVVVVADRGSYVLLWTAYPVDRRHRQLKLAREFEDYWRRVRNG